MSITNQTNRIKSLQALLKKNNIDAFMIGTSDKFQGEYVAKNDQRLAWITGFKGSLGCAIIETEKATLFVDGRYTIQAEREINKDIFKIESLVTLPPHNWIKKNIKEDSIIGYDPNLWSIEQINNTEKKIQNKNIHLKPIKNLIDELWINKEPKIFNKIYSLPKNYTGLNFKEKINKIKEIIQKKGIDNFLFTMSCSISWLLNIRGNDVPYNPIAHCYFLLKNNEKSIIYIEKEHYSLKLKNYLQNLVNIKNIDNLESDIITMNENLGIDYSLSSKKFEEIANKNNNKSLKLFNLDDPVRNLKLYKNNSEIKGIKECQIIDSFVMSKMLHWISSTPIEEQSEIKNEKKLEEFRKKADFFKDLSFATISAINENAALPHYKTNPQKDIKFKNNSIYLIDSGSQYKMGTTDITRTIAIGIPTKEQKHNFTLVLKGLIALTTKTFTKEFTFKEMDLIARSFLLNEGKDYNHGTGHGVGAFLNVHEGPVNISKKDCIVPLKEGIYISNEPGFYKENEYGIRIENLMILRKNKEKRTFYWENVTYCPIDKNLIEINILTKQEKEWIDSYHKKTLSIINNYIKNSQKQENKLLQWLKKACSPL